MTEPMSPFGGTAVAAPPTEMTPPSEIAGPSDSRRKLVMVGAVVVVLVLAAAAYFLLVKGNGSSDVPTNVVSHGQVAAGHHPAGSSSAKTPKTVTLPGKAKKPAGRNPFLALVTQPVGSTKGSKSVSNSSGSQPVSQPATGTAPVTQPGGTTSKGSKHQTQSAPLAPAWVELASVQGTKSATFVVGYTDGSTRSFVKVKVPTGAAQTVFGTDFALLSITDGHATVKFGDGTPFDLARGFKNRHNV